MIIPLRDINPSSSFPFITILLICINIVVFILQATLPEAELASFYGTFGLMPARFLGSMNGITERSVLNEGMTLFTSMFLHGGPMHIIGNMWILWLLGDNVEDRLGHFTFLGFYLLAGIGASLVHAVIYPASTVPTIGASGAIAGVMAAYVLMFPKAKIKVLVFLVIFITTINVPAFIFIGLWFMTQLFNGLGSLSAGEASGIAFWAHIGGFLAGIILVIVNKIQPRRRRVKTR